jgi:hypothetical protein
VVHSGGYSKDSAMAEMRKYGPKDVAEALAAASRRGQRHAISAVTVEESLLLEGVRLLRARHPNSYVFVPAPRFL